MPQELIFYDWALELSLPVRSVFFSSFFFLFLKEWFFLGYVTRDSIILILTVPVLYFLIFLYPSNYYIYTLFVNIALILCKIAYILFILPNRVPLMNVGI